MELETGPEVGDTFEGFDIDDDTAAAVLSTLFKIGLGKCSSSAKSYSGEEWFLGTGIGSDLTTNAAAPRLDLMVVNEGTEAVSPDYAHWISRRYCRSC